jgi:hypothetical protein
MECGKIISRSDIMSKLESKLMIKNTLLNIASVLNENNINWGLGGSLLLYLSGIETNVADIDIVVDDIDTNKIEEIVKKYDYIEKKESGIYLTNRFYSITYEGICIDLMLGFKISNGNSVYSFPTGKKLVDKSIIIDGTVINLCSLKDWLEAYTAMKRKNKIELINHSKLVK